MQPVQKFFSISEAARILGISAKTLRRWDKSGKVKINRTPNGDRIFTLEEIEKLKGKVSPFTIRQELPQEQIVRPSLNFSAPNLKFLIAGFSILLIALLYTNFILALNLKQDNRVLGVETFLAPVSRSEIWLRQIVSEEGPVIRFFSNISNSLRLAVGTALVSLLPKDLVQTREKTVKVISETFLPDNLVLSSLDVSGNSTLSTAAIGTLAVTNDETIGGTLIVTGDTTLKSDLKVEKNITLTGVINSTRITDNKLVFGGDSPTIYPGTTNTGISLNGNGTGAISIGNSSTGDIYLGGGSSSNTRCFVTNASGNLTCSGDLIANGGDILTSSGTLRIGSSSTTVNIAGTLTVGSSTTTITTNSVTTGQISLTRVPTSAHTGTWAIGSSTWNVSDSSFYINPASAGADTNLFGIAIDGSVRFAVDAEGDTFANNLVVAGSTTTASTTIAGTLSIEGNTTIGDSTTDTLTVNPATITLAGGNKTIDITGAATRTLTLLNSTASQVANLDLSDGVYSIGGSLGQTIAACGASQYLGGVAVTGGIITTLGSCTTVSSAWSGLTNPTGNLSLSMGANTTTFTWNAATGASTNLFNLTDTSSNTGTGYLLTAITQASSNLKPFQVQARGNAIIDTTSTGGLTLGNTTAAQDVNFFSTSNKITSAGALTLAGGVTAGGVISAPNGTAAAPSIAFTNSQGTGIYRAGTDILGLSTAGSQRIQVDASGNVTINGNVTLTVNGNTVFAGTTAPTLSSAGQGKMYFDSTANQFQISQNASSYQGLWDQPQPNLVLNSDFGRRNKWMTFMPETFTDTSGWTANVGTLGTVGANILTAGSTGTWEAAAKAPAIWRDARFSAQGKMTDTANLIGVGKQADTNNAVLAYLTGANFILAKNIAGGGYSTVTSTAYTPTLNNWYWIELEAQGTTYIAKLYSSGASPVAKSSATLAATITGTISDAAVAAGTIFLRANVTTASQWGGLSTGDGGVYVEGWGPEGWTPAYTGTVGGQAIGFNETADIGPISKQWTMSLYIPATSRGLNLDTGGLPDGGMSASTTYAHSIYLNTSGKGGSGALTTFRVQEGPSNQSWTTNNDLSDAGETSWTRKTGTFTTQSTTRRTRYIIYGNLPGTATGTAYFMLPQLEQGSVATPWRNAPADDGPIVWNIAINSSGGATTTSATYVEPVFGGQPGGNPSLNAFIPWDTVVRATFTGAGDNSGDGNNTSFDITADGSPMYGGAAVTQLWRYVQRNAASGDPYEIVPSGTGSFAAGKHRFAPRFKTSAGTTSIFADPPPQLVLVATRGKFDLAEEYSVNDLTIEPGDVVRLASSSLATSSLVEKTDKGYDSSVLGIVSTAPGITLSSQVELNSYKQKLNLRPVALSGRVPVKVTNENGVIRRGDMLTSSAIKPGYAMSACARGDGLRRDLASGGKATTCKAGRSIGVAMEDFAPASSDQLLASSLETNQPEASELEAIKTGRIMTFVNLSWYDPDVYLTDSGQFVINKVTEQPTAQLASDGTATSSATPSVQYTNALMHYTLQNNSTKETIERAGAFSDLFVANLKVGKLDATEITKLTELEQRLRNLEIGTQSAVLSASISGLLNDQTATSSGILSSLIVSGRTVLNDLGITGNISIGLLSINGIESSISSLSDIRLRVPGGEILIDKDGNLKVLNTITAQKVEADIFASAKASGSSVLPANTASMDVISDNATETAKILITPTTLTDKVLTITQKSAGKFTVSVKVVEPQDIKFDWFIIQ